MQKKANLLRTTGAPPTPTTMAKMAASSSSSTAASRTTTKKTMTATAATNKKRKRRTRTPGRAGQPLSAYNIFFRYERARIIALNSSRQQQQKSSSGADNSVVVSDSDSDDERNNQQKRHPQPPQQSQQQPPPPAEEQKPPRQPITEQTLRTFLSQNPYQTPRNRKKRLHRRTHGAVSFTELNSIVSRNWKSLDEESKRAFLDVAAELRVEHYRRLEEEVRREMTAAEEQAQAQTQQTQIRTSDSPIEARRRIEVTSKEESNDAAQRGGNNNKKKTTAMPNKTARTPRTETLREANGERQRVRNDNRKKKKTAASPSNVLSLPKEADDAPQRRDVIPKNKSSTQKKESSANKISFPRRVSAEPSVAVAANEEACAAAGSKEPRVVVPSSESPAAALRAMGKKQRVVVVAEKKERREAAPKKKPRSVPLSKASTSDGPTPRAATGKERKEASPPPPLPPLQMNVSQPQCASVFHRWSLNMQRKKWNDLMVAEKPSTPSPTNKKRKVPSPVTPSPSPRGCISTPTTLKLEEAPAANLSTLSAPMLDEPPLPSKRPRHQRESAPTVKHSAAAHNRAVVEPVVVPSVEPVVAPSTDEKHPLPLPRRCLLTELLEESLAAAVVSPVGPTVVPSSNGAAQGYHNGAAMSNGGVDDSCEEGFVSVLDLEFAGLWLLSNPASPPGANYGGEYPQQRQSNEEVNRFTAAQNSTEFRGGATANPVPSSSSPPSSSFSSSLPSLSKPSEDEANFMGELLELAS